METQGPELGGIAPVCVCGVTPVYACERGDGQRPTPFECVSRRCNTPYSPYYFRPQPVRRAVLAPGARLGASTSGHVGRGRRGWPQDAACYRERENLRAYCQGGTLQVGHTGGAPGPHPLGSLCPLRSADQWSDVGAESCSCPARSSICVKWECFLAVPFI